MCNHRSSSQRSPTPNSPTAHTTPATSTRSWTFTGSRANSSASAYVVRQPAGLRQHHNDVDITQPPCSQGARLRPVCTHPIIPAENACRVGILERRAPWCPCRPASRRRLVDLACVGTERCGFARGGPRQPPDGGCPAWPGSQQNWARNLASGIAKRATVPKADVVERANHGYELRHEGDGTTSAARTVAQKTGCSMTVQRAPSGERRGPNDARIDTSPRRAGPRAHLSGVSGIVEGLPRCLLADRSALPSSV